MKLFTRKINPGELTIELIEQTEHYQVMKKAFIDAQHKCAYSRINLHDNKVLKGLLHMEEAEHQGVKIGLKEQVQINHTLTADAVELNEKVSDLTAALAESRIDCAHMETERDEFKESVISWRGHYYTTVAKMERRYNGLKGAMTRLRNINKALKAESSNI